MFAIIGDGGFQMCCMEIMTAVNYNKPLNIILFQQQQHGAIRKNQIQSYDNVLSTAISATLTIKNWQTHSASITP